jgi:integral membrane protein
VSGLADVKTLDGALARYRVMAAVVGCGLLVLVFVGMPLQFAARRPEVVAVVGPLHGFLYIVYLVAALDLARRARFSFAEMLAMVGAGLLPFLAFIIERRITRRVRTEVLPTWTLPSRRPPSDARPVVPRDP